MAETFVTSAADIRRSLQAFNAEAPRVANRDRALNLLSQTKYWVYDPDAEQFGPAKFVGLSRMEFKAYETKRREVSGADTHIAIERALDDLFVAHSAWHKRLRQWGEALVGTDAFGGVDEGKWRFTSLRAKSGKQARLTIEDEDEREFPEGALSYAIHRKRDRSAALVANKKRLALAASGALTCAVCGFDFRKRYGPLGQGYIECHHTVPVSELIPNSKTRLEDVALVCSNCHRMIHRKRPWLKIQELSALLTAV